MNLKTDTKFLFSTSGSPSSIVKHNFALQSLSTNFVYHSFDHEISPEEYGQLLRSPITRGGAVTGQGLKSGIIPFLDDLDLMAQKTGAVNTVVNQKGKLYGYNTDAYGFKSALTSHLKKYDLKIESAVIYGNGGVSGVASYILKSMDILVTMAGRNEERVKRKMQELNLEVLNGPYDLVVNATPISSFPLYDSPVLLDILHNCKIVFDHNMPEKDDQTNYLEQYCRQNDKHFIPGGEMYVPQLIKQWQFFLNGAADPSGQRIEVTEKDIVECWSLE